MLPSKNLPILHLAMPALLPHRINLTLKGFKLHLILRVDHLLRRLQLLLPIQVLLVINIHLLLQFLNIKPQNPNGLNLLLQIIPRYLQILFHLLDVDVVELLLHLAELKVHLLLFAVDKTDFIDARPSEVLD